MTHKVDGIYSNPDGYWQSNEWFVKQGEVRVIDGKLHYLSWSSITHRAWRPVDPDYAAIHGVVDARCVLKKVSTSRAGRGNE